MVLTGSTGEEQQFITYLHFNPFHMAEARIRCRGHLNDDLVGWGEEIAKMGNTRNSLSPPPPLAHITYILFGSVLLARTDVLEGSRKVFCDCVVREGG
jgi:hypothetical protein